MATPPRWGAKGKGQTDETLHYNQLNVGSLSIDAKGGIQAQVGQHVQLDQLAKQPGMAGLRRASEGRQRFPSDVAGRKVLGWPCGPPVRSTSAAASGKAHRAQEDWPDQMGATCWVDSSRVVMKSAHAALPLASPFQSRGCKCGSGMPLL